MIAVFYYVCCSGYSQLFESVSTQEPEVQGHAETGLPTLAQQRSLTQTMTVGDQTQESINLFDQFVIANTCHSILSVFQQLCDCLDIHPLDHTSGAAFYHTLKGKRPCLLSYPVILFGYYFKKQSQCAKSIIRSMTVCSVGRFVPIWLFSKSKCLCGPFPPSS